jgi:hypothetical protein
VVSRVFFAVSRFFLSSGGAGTWLFVRPKGVCTLCTPVHVGSFALQRGSFLDRFRLIRLHAYKHNVRHDVRQNRCPKRRLVPRLPGWPSREPLPLTVRSWRHMFMPFGSASGMTCGESGRGSQTSRRRRYVEGMERRTSRSWRARCVGPEPTMKTVYAQIRGVSNQARVQISEDAGTSTHSLHATSLNASRRWAGSRAFVSGRGHRDIFELS